MQKSLRPLAVIVALLFGLMTMAYIGGYFALSLPYSGPGERIFGAKWQYDLYVPLTDVEAGIRGTGFRCGFRS
jgi:hypothetical protein